MKHVFECGIVATANDAVGREFLVGLVDGEAYGHDWMARHITGTRDDFTITIADMEIMSMRDRSIFDAKMAEFTSTMLALGYERLAWYEMEHFCMKYRFKK